MVFHAFLYIFLQVRKSVLLISCVLMGLSTSFLKKVLFLLYLLNFHKKYIYILYTGVKGEYPLNHFFFYLCHELLFRYSICLRSFLRFLRSILATSCRSLQYSFLIWFKRDCIMAIRSMEDFSDKTFPKNENRKI